VSSTPVTSGDPVTMCRLELAIGPTRTVLESLQTSAVKLTAFSFAVAFNQMTNCKASVAN